MPKNTVVGLILSCAALGWAISASAAEEWHFVVKNKTSSNITKLEVSENKSNRGNFDIAEGIGPGEKATLVWAASTNDHQDKMDPWRLLVAFGGIWRLLAAFFFLPLVGWWGIL